MTTNQTKTPRSDRIRIRKVDYKALARWAGENAYRRAKANGLSEDVAKEFKKIFSKPIPQELRFN